MAILKKHAKELEELMLLDKAYGRKLTWKRKIAIIVIPVALSSGFYYILSQNIWFSIPFSLAVIVYFYLKLMPAEVKQNYEDSSFNARNLLLNNLGTSVMDKSKIPLLRMTRVTDLLLGSTNEGDEDYSELKKDYSTLIARLSVQDGYDTDEAFSLFIQRYKDDIFFVQAFESLRALLRGQKTEKAFQDIVRQHNSLNTSNDDMRRKLNGQKRDFTMASIIGIGVMMFMMYSIVPTIGQADLDKAYIKVTGGIIVSLVTMFIYLFYTNGFYDKFYDRDLTRLGKPKKVKKNKFELTEEEQAEEDARFMSIGLNQLLFKTMSKSEKKQARQMYWTDRKIAGFQQKRVALSISLSVVGASFAYTMSEKVSTGVIGLILSMLLIYWFQGRTISSKLDEYQLERAVAFATFKQRLNPYMQNASSNNESQTLNRVASLMSGDDRKSVYRLISDLENDQTDAPYVAFARRMSPDPRAVTEMQTYYSAFRIRDASEMIDSMAKETNTEYMLKVADIGDRKIRRFGNVSITTVVICLIPLFALLFSYLSFATLQSFSSI